MKRARYSQHAFDALNVKLQAIGRRSPKHFHALHVLADAVLERLGPEEEAEPYQWKCDEPKPKGGS